jgi:YopT-type cysteine protease-like protein
MIVTPHSSQNSFSNTNDHDVKSRHFMPASSDLNHPEWKSLPPLLKQATLARFDQSRCTNNHGISERAMCFGLSLSWLERVKQHGSHASHYAAAERMNHLASFEGVVNSRILHNYYRHEHASQMNEALSRGDEGKASLAGTDSLIQAAEYKNIKLKPVLKNQMSEELPFLTMITSSGRYIQDDKEAFKTFESELAATNQGVIAIYSTEGAHALGFSQSESGKKIVFDPNCGEFEFDKHDFQGMINTLSMESRLPLAGVQIFKSV